MDIQKREELKEWVLRFLRSQDGYDADNLEEISINISRGACTILYGQSIEAGIFGRGISIEDAFLDFVRKWNAFNGFKWMQEVKTLN